PVDFATSVVSFERVFEVIDLPIEIEEKADAKALEQVRGDLRFENVTFVYKMDERLLLSEVDRFDEDDETLSGEASNGNAGRSTHTQARDVALKNINVEIKAGQL